MLSKTPWGTRGRPLQSRRAKDENYVYKVFNIYLGSRKTCVKYPLAPMLDPNDLAAGYNWPVHTDEDGEGKPMELYIALGIAFLKRKDISRAIQVFKEFERQESKILDQAATNLSFLYFLEGIPNPQNKLLWILSLLPLPPSPLYGTTENVY
ncbi:hypothetical protein AAMO2058_000844100 [Amorphochlora amoebiformis]